MAKAALAQFEIDNAGSISKTDINYYKTVFLGEIVSASTLAPPGAEVDTSLRCRKRPERKQCHGLIRVQLQEYPAELRWWCPVCGDNGTINSWKGIPWKKSHIRTSDDHQADDLCEIHLSFKDFQLLRQISILDEDAVRVVKNAIKVNDGMLLLGRADAIDSLIGYIAFEVNHEAKYRRQLMLERLFDKICSVLKCHW